MKPAFTELHSPRIHAIIRSIFFWIIFMFLLFVLSTQIGRFVPAQWERYAYGIFGTIAAVLTTFIALKFERRSFADIGLVWERRTLLRFLKGILIGTVVFTLIIVILLSITQLQLEKNSKAFTLSAAFWYLAYIPLALMEEIAFRSYPFLKMNKVLGLRITQIIVAVAFALYHVVSGWSITTAFLGPAIWALVFGLAAIWSGGIALPTGIHVALNVLQSLLGTKSENFESLWIIKYKEGVTKEAMAWTDQAGLATQFLVLAAALILTEFFIRKRRKHIADQHIKS